MPFFINYLFDFSLLQKTQNFVDMLKVLYIFVLICESVGK